MKTLVRTANQNDIKQILPVWRELMEMHAQLDPFLACREGAEELFAEYVAGNIQEASACVLVAEADGRVVGYCQGKVGKHPPVLKTVEFGQICDCAVLEAYRHQGLGQQMLNKMFEWFRRRGLFRIEVRCSVHNEISRSFWRKAGFEPYMENLFYQLSEQVS